MRKDILSGNMYLAIVIGLGSFSDGFALLLQSGALLSLVPYFKLNSLSTGLVVSAPFIGSVIGALIFGWLADKLGRKAILLNVLVFFVFASILSSLSVNVQMLILSRLLVGVGIGGDIPASGALIAENVEADRRGSLLSTQTILWAIGAASATFVALPLLSAGLQSWRVLLGLAALPPLITLILRRRIPESFKWKSVHSAESSTPSRRAIYLTAILSIGLFIWTMVLAIFASYLPSLLVKLYGLPQYESLLIGTVQWLMFLAGTIIVFRSVDIIGRRRLIFIGTLIAIAASIAVYLIGGHNYAVLTLSVLSIWAAGGIAYTAISIYSFEIPPTLYRGMLSGTVFGSGRMGGYVGTLIFPILLGALGIAKTFGIVGPAMSSIILAFLAFNQKTEKLDLEKIEEAIKR